MDFAAGTVLLVNKPLRWTSFDVVNKIGNALKRKLGSKIKVGHAGTLDPLATGLLIVCTGKFTKTIDTYQAQEKEYTGTMLLGATTPTLDAEMEPDHLFPTEHITPDLITLAAQNFIGEIQQVPPIYSALKVKGQTAYSAARKGIELEMKPRTVTIHEFELTNIELPSVSFRVVCSKGTYIRSLVRDLGTAVGSGAYMTGLCRTRSGDKKLMDAWEVPALLEYINNMP
jgi:tRNA pseudouridine55 synthase